MLLERELLKAAATLGAPLRIRDHHGAARRVGRESYSGVEMLNALGRFARERAVPR